MNKRDFLVRIVVTPVLFLLASLFGVITSSWWAAPLMGFGFALAFTFFSERIGRNVSVKLSTLVKGAAMSFHFFQVLFDSVVMVLLFAVFSFAFGLSAVHGWGFNVTAVITWAFLTRESLFSLPMLFGLWLATRGK